MLPPSDPTPLAASRRARPGAAVGAGGWFGTLPPRTLRARLALPNVLLVVAVMAALSGYLVLAVRGLYTDRLADELTDQAELVAELVRPQVAAGADPAALDATADRLAARMDARVTVIAWDGTVLAETYAAAELTNHLTRPEVQEALRGEAGREQRRSQTFDEDFLYVGVGVAVPADGVGRFPTGFAEVARPLPPRAVVRVAVPTREIDAAVWRIRRDLLVAALVAALLAAVVATIVAGRLTRPLENLRWLTRSVAAGRLDVSVEPDGTQELGELGLAFNAMTADLRDLVAEIDRSRTRLEAVLGALGDGVVITNAEGGVVRLNAVAARLLGTTTAEATGRPFVVVSRDYELAGLLRLALATGQTRAATVEYGLDRRLLDAAAKAVSGGGELLGLVVLRDVTELRRLEAVRREFVANVSHELRTPLASVKALVETLEHGALDDPPVAQDFLGRIVGEVDRLAALVDELLDLARLESGRVALRLADLDPAELLATGVERLAPLVERARLRLDLEVPPDLPPVRADRARVEQVLLNLVHNAVKFTPAGGRIAVGAEAADGLLRVRVSDTGVGVSEDELPRLFERFYKADKARRSDGTGLGLAIAKHIVGAHGGQIWAESAPGRGATFTFTLPLAGATPEPAVPAATAAGGA